MKKFLVSTLVAAAIGSAAIGVQASPASPSNSLSAGKAVQIDQILRDARRDRRWNNRNNGRVHYQTRIVRYGRKTYRDTYRIEWRDGREKTKRVSHVRIY